MKFDIVPKTVWPEVTSENYYDLEMSRVYMGSTQMKRFVECEAATMAWLSGEYQYPDSNAFLEGRLGHAWNEGKLDEFLENNPGIISTRGATKGQWKSNFKKIGNAIKALERQPLAMKALSGTHEVIFTAELFGIPWKIAIDSYNPEENMFSDLKFLKSLWDKKWVTNEEGIGGYESVFEAYGYLTQIAAYAEVERIASNRKEALIPYIVVATKDDVPDVAILSFNSDEEPYTAFISRQLGLIARYMQRIKAVKHGDTEPVRCGRCDYCKQTKQLTGTQHYTLFNPY